MAGRMKTPERILDYLRKHPSASAPELSRLTGLTVQNLRHHLLALVREGLIEPESTPRAGQPGRPQKYYSLSQRSKSDQSETLLRAVLSFLTQDGEKDEKSPAWLSAAAQHLAGNVFNGIHSPSQRLNLTVKRMAELGYHLHWEARPHNPRLYIDYSPFSALANDFTPLENLDSLLVERMTGYTLKRLSPSESSRTIGDGHVYTIVIQ